MEQEHGQDFRSQPLALPGPGKIWRLGQGDDSEVFAYPDNLSLFLQLLIVETGDTLDLVVTIAPKKSGSVEQLEFSVVDQTVENGQGAAVDLVDAVQDRYPAFDGSLDER